MSGSPRTISNASSISSGEGARQRLRDLLPAERKAVHRVEVLVGHALAVVEHEVDAARHTRDRSPLLTGSSQVRSRRTGREVRVTRLLARPPRPPRRAPRARRKPGNTRLGHGHAPPNGSANPNRSPNGRRRPQWCGVTRRRRRVRRGGGLRSVRLRVLRGLLRAWACAAAWRRAWPRCRRSSP